MRLADLEPRWIGFGYPLPECPGAVWHIGISFLCPHCRTQRLAVLFEPEIESGGIREKFSHWDSYKEIKSSRFIWNRKGGETFETLTLMPSINAEWAGHWHGHIDNGEVS